MTRRVRNRSRAALFGALFAALMCVLLAPQQRPSIGVPVTVLTLPTIDSSALVAALPSVLSPPVLKPGSRLVSMVAEDIDADGDLDVVASDGTLNLIVWTNDGSGRLSPRQGHDVAVLQSEPDDPDFSHSSRTADSLVPSASVSLEIGPRSFGPAPNQSLLLADRSVLAPASPIASTRAPRGPPASNS
jgi:hypothetical protein